MQSEIDLYNPLQLRENVLLPKTQQLERTSAINLSNQAKYYAKRIIESATHDSDLIKEKAYQSGYEKGLLMSLEAVMCFLSEKQNIIDDVSRHAREDVKKSLEETVNKEKVICVLLESWAGEIEKHDKVMPFHILIPRHRCHYKRRLLACIDRIHPGGAVFEYHQDSRYVFKYGEQLVEFSPEKFIHDHGIAFTARPHLYEACENISSEALHALHSMLKGYDPSVCPSTVDNEINEREHSSDND